MSFITQRRAINATAGIAAGLNARAIIQNKVDPDFKAFTVAFEALANVSIKLDKYYKAHGLLGRIVKWFDTHAIGGLFGKKSKIDALYVELVKFYGNALHAVAKAANAEVLPKAPQESEEVAPKAPEESEEVAPNAAEESEEVAPKAPEESEEVVQKEDEVLKNANARKQNKEASDIHLLRAALAKDAERRNPDGDLSEIEKAVLAKLEEERLAEVARKEAERKAVEEKNLKAATQASLNENANRKNQGDGMDPDLAFKLARQASKVTLDQEQSNAKKSN